jgi:hypothetical protein
MIHVLTETDADTEAIGLAQAAAGGRLFGVAYQVIRVPPGAVPARAAANGAIDWTAVLSAAAGRLGAAHLANAVTAVTGETLDPEVIGGIERLTGETYHPGTGTWTGP